MLHKPVCDHEPANVHGDEQQRLAREEHHRLQHRYGPLLLVYTAQREHQINQGNGIEEVQDEGRQLEANRRGHQKQEGKKAFEEEIKRIVIQRKHQVFDVVPPHPEIERGQKRSRDQHTENP